MISPCKDCNKRCTNCHSSCDSYKDWLAESKKQKEWLKEKNGINTGLSYASITRIIRAEKRCAMHGDKSYRF